MRVADDQDEDAGGEADAGGDEDAVDSIG